MNMIQTRRAPNGSRLLLGMSGAARLAGLTLGDTAPDQGGLPRPPDPAPAAPADGDAAARLDTHDTQLADHEARLVRIEGILNLQPEPAPAAPGAQAAIGDAKASTVLDARAILARHGEHRQARAAAGRGGHPGTIPAQQAPPRQSPPTSCTTLDSNAVYARLHQQRAGRR